jgi:Ser/Thr protein kinase RdoA (MazF antagonist)
MAGEELVGNRVGKALTAGSGEDVAPPAGMSRLETFIGAMCSRSGVERLQSHLEATYGIAVTRISELDLGVFRVDQRSGPSWVARLFPAVRAVERAAGDAEILDLLAGCGFPAERCAVPDAASVSLLDGQGLLVTEHVNEVPRGERREEVRRLGGVRALAEMLGRLHALPAAGGAAARDGGAWHHLTDGRPEDEIAAAAGLLADAEGLVPDGDKPLYESLREEVEAIDGCTGLPQALIHPDFVMANVLASPERGLVVVDWTGAGRGPRLWPLAFLLYSQGVLGLRRVDYVVDGYRRQVRLEPEELARLAEVVRARPVIFETWAFCVGRRGLAEVVQRIAAAREQADAITARARLAFAGGAP